jgi:hypothetical protein
MSALVQNILSITLIACCAVWAIWQGVRSIAGKPSKLGSCCQKGCSAAQNPPPGEKVHFLPLHSLKRRVS